MTAGLTSARFGLGLLLILTATNSGLDTGEGRAASEYAVWLTERGTLGRPAPSGPLYTEGLDGRYYPAHEMGNAAAMIPVTAAARRVAPALGFASDRSRDFTQFAVSFLPCLYVAATAAALWYAVTAGLHMSAAAASGAGLLLVFTTYLWPYSRTLFDGVLAGALVTSAAAWVMAGASRSSGWFFVLGGVSLGAAVATRITCAVLVPAFLWYVGSRRSSGSSGFLGSRAPLLRFVAGLLPFAIWQAYYNALRTGSLVMPAVALPAFATNNGFAPPWIGAAGMLLSPGKAIWLYAPTVVLVLLGFRRFWREQPHAARFVLFAAGPFVLLHASIRNWSGDWGWGPRYLVTILPLLFLAVPFAIDRCGPARRRLTVVLIATGLALQVPALIINWEYRYIYLRQQTGRSPDAWSIRRSQFVDALGASGRNLRRAAGGEVPMEVAEGAHPVNIHASNHVNVWWLTAPHAGVPVVLCVVLAAALLLGGCALLLPFVQAARTGR